jgi:hypothetical protein
MSLVIHKGSAVYFRRSPLSLFPQGSSAKTMAEENKAIRLNINLRMGKNFHQQGQKAFQNRSY